MFAMQEPVRQLRDEVAHQVPGGWVFPERGGMFAVMGSLVLTNAPPRC